MGAEVKVLIDIDTKGAPGAKDGAAAIGATAGAADRASAAGQRLDTTNKQLYASQIAVARAQRDHAGAIALADARLRTLTPNTAEYNRVLAQQITLSRQASAGAGAGGLGGQLVGLAGSFGLATTGAALFAATVSAGFDSFKLAATFEANQQAVRRFVGDQERANQILDTGARFADKYAFSQAEIAAALAGSSDALRRNGADAEKLLEVYALLLSRNPAENLQGAQFAVSELISGDTTSIKERFGVSGDTLDKLKQDLAQGRSATDALIDALARLGVTQDALADRTKGSQGALNELNKSWSDLKLSFGQGLADLGAADVLKFIADDVKNTTTTLKPLGDALRRTREILDGEFSSSMGDAGGNVVDFYNKITGLGDGFSDLVTRTNQLEYAIVAVDAAGVTNLETTLQQQAAAAKLAEAKVRIEEAARKVESGFYTEGDAAIILARQLGIATDEAKRLLAVQQLLNRFSAPDRARQLANSVASNVAGGGVRELEQAEREIERAREKAIADAERARKRAASEAERNAERAARDAEQYAKRLAEARDALRTDQEKLANRLSEYDQTTDQARRLELEREILDLRQKIADQSEREARAALAAREARLDDADADAKALKAYEQAQAVLRSDSTSAAQKAAARRVIDRLGLENQQRELDIAGKEREAGRALAGPAVPPTGTPQTGAGPIGLPPDSTLLPRATVPAMAMPQLPPMGAQGGPRRLIIELRAPIQIVLPNGEVLMRDLIPIVCDAVAEAESAALDRVLAAGVLEVGY